jgi:hypothetical protein
MRRHVAVLLALAMLAGSAWAEVDIAERRPTETSAADIFDNPENFAVHGVIADRIATRDSDSFKRDILRFGVMLHYASPYEFVAVGASRNDFRQDRFSGGVNSIVLAARKTNRRTAEGFTGRLAVTTNTEKTDWHGEATWNHKFTEQTGIEVVASRDAVETIGALREGILSNFVGVSIAHDFSDRFTAIAMPTYQRFTDGNVHRGGRGWLIYNLFPAWGIGTELKAQTYDGTGGSNGLYFSPDDYERAEAGLRIRQSFNGWRIIGGASAGRERINREIEKPTRTARLVMQKSFNNNLTAGLQFSYFQASNSGTDISSNDEYSWRMSRIFIAVPF